jgi:degradative hydroxymethylglutaryl-CoA reductase
MFSRGGGVKNIFVRVLSLQFFVLEIIVNTCESMGANLLSKISEELSKYLFNKNYIKIKPLMCILSNFSVYKKYTSEFKIKINDLNYKGIEGKEIAEKIIKSIEIAKLDVFRACTNNKGIMNGIDAVAIALGQDVRAIEAGIHVYASVEVDEENNSVSYSNYKPLSSYSIINENNESFLFGSLTVPLCSGTVGGAIDSNSVYKNNFEILNNPNCEWLGFIMCSVGLAQNFAALRALVSEGISKGHFNLHAKNVAIRAGVPDEFVGDAVEFMKEKNGINDENAKEFMKKIKF